LLDLGFGDLPLLDLSAQLPVGLIQFARSSFNAALERFFDTFVIGDVECDPVKRNRRVVRENGLPTRRDPAFHPVRFSNYSVLDIVHPIAPWVGALLDSGREVTRVPTAIVVARLASIIEGWLASLVASPKIFRT
jgi:hypothetical protein